MKEKIYTIPINECFEQKSGCPLCALYARSREHALDYITGSAMMEPSVRIVTNEQGFCRQHFSDMLAMKTRLSVALTQQSHMDEVAKRCYDAPRGVFGRGVDVDKAIAAVKKQTSSCFVCSRISEEMEHYVSNVVFMWKSEDEFKQLYAEQEGFCLPHYAALLEAGKAKLSKKELFDFAKITTELAKHMHELLTQDLAAFTKSFDYRFTGEAKTERVKGSIENTAAYLTGGKV